MATYPTMRNALLLALGAGIGPLVQLVATHWLARLYQPVDFGNLALFMSAAGIVVAVSCFRYEVAIAAVDDDSIPSAVWVAVGSALIVFLLLLLVVGLHAPQAFSPRLEELGRKLWGVPIYGLCGGLVLIGMQLTLRRSEFGLNATFRSAQTVLFVLLALLCTDLGLVEVSMLSGAAAALIVVLYLVKSVPQVGARPLGRVAWAYRKHPFFLTPTSLLDAVALSAPVFFISSAYGASETGHYSQIQKLVGAPLILAALVTGQLFLKRSGEIYRGGQSSGPLLWKVVGVQGLLAGLTIVFLVAVGEHILGLLLGAAWRVDTVFLLLATTPLLFRVIVSPVTSVLITHKRIEVGMRWQIGYFVSTAIVLYIASTNMSFENFLMIYTLHEAAAYSVYLYLVNQVAQKATY